MYLGLDLGTSGVKALLIDADQRVIGSANGALSVSRPHSGCRNRRRPIGCGQHAKRLPG